MFPKKVFTPQDGALRQKGRNSMDSVIQTTIENVIQGTDGDDQLQGTDANDQIIGGGGADEIAGGKGDDLIDAGGMSDTVDAGSGHDTVDGGDGDDLLIGGLGHDVLTGGQGEDQLHGGVGNDSLKGGGGADVLGGGNGDDYLNGGNGADILGGGAGNDHLKGGAGDDRLEGGAGNDHLNGGGGDDWLLGFSWGGEPVPAQDADALVNTGEPLEDTDTMRGGDGADKFEFRWLIDAKDEIIAKHTDENGDIDYSMNGVAGENDNTHDHWVETIGTKIVKDYDAGEGDTLVFKGHTVNLDTVTHADYDGDGSTDTILTFVSNQGGAGAHDGDQVGTVVILDNVIDSVDVDAGVFYGVEEPWSAAG
jgi:hypothetical protein